MIKKIAIVLLSSLTLVLLWYRINICQARILYKISDISTLLEELNSDKLCIRSQAAFDIQSQGKKGEPAVTRLIELLNDEEPSVRWRSIAALGYIGLFNEQINDVIFNALNDPNEHVRYNALFAMFRMGYQPPLNQNEKLVPIENYKYTDKNFEAFLQGLNDSVPRNQYKALLHLDMLQVINNGDKYRETLRTKFFELLNSPDDQVKTMAFFRIHDLLGEEDTKKLIPDYASKFTESYKTLYRHNK